MQARHYVAVFMIGVPCIFLNIFYNLPYTFIDVRAYNVTQYVFLMIIFLASFVDFFCGNIAAGGMMIRMMDDKRKKTNFNVVDRTTRQKKLVVLKHPLYYIIMFIDYYRISYYTSLLLYINFSKINIKQAQSTPHSIYIYAFNTTKIECIRQSSTQQQRKQQHGRERRKEKGKEEVLFFM